MDASLNKIGQRCYLQSNGKSAKKKEQTDFPYRARNKVGFRYTLVIQEALKELVYVQNKGPEWQTIKGRNPPSEVSKTRCSMVYENQCSISSSTSRKQINAIPET